MTFSQMYDELQLHSGSAKKQHKKKDKINRNKKTMQMNSYWKDHFTGNESKPSDRMPNGVINQKHKTKPAPPSMDRPSFA